MITYQPLLDKLKKKKMSLRELMLETEIAPNTMTRIRKNKYVSLEILEKFCKVLGCDFKDVVSFKDDENITETGENNDE